MPSNYDDVVEKHKKYLTRAQIDRLAAASKEFGALNAANRAGALAQVREQYDAGYRGLQNMGLAGGLEQQPTSGEVPRLAQQVNMPFETYNRKLREVENAQLASLGQSMENATKLARAEAARKKAEEEAAAEAAARAAQLQRVETLRQREADEKAGTMPNNKAIIDPRFGWNNRDRNYNMTDTGTSGMDAPLLAAAQMYGIQVPNGKATVDPRYGWNNQGTNYGMTDTGSNISPQNAPLNAAAQMYGIQTAKTSYFENSYYGRDEKVKELDARRAKGETIPDDEYQSALDARDLAKMRTDDPELYKYMLNPDQNAPDSVVARAAMWYIDRSANNPVAASNDFEKAKNAYEDAEHMASITEETPSMFQVKAGETQQSNLKRTYTVNMTDTGSNRTRTGTSSQYELPGMYGTKYVSGIDKPKEEPEYLVKARSDLSMARMRAEDPEAYKAFQVLQYKDLFEKTDPAAVENAYNTCVDYTMKSMGLRTPEMDDAEYENAKTLAPGLETIIKKIDSYKKSQEKTTSPVSNDYYARYISDLDGELKDRYNMTEDEARDLLKRYNKEHDSRLEYNYYRAGVLAGLTHEGEKPSKEVNTGEADDVYRFVNGLPSLQMSGMGGMAKSSIPEDYRVTKYMNQQQKDAYNAIYETDGVKAANQYIRDIIPMLNIARAQQDEEYYKKFADEHPLWADIRSVGANLLWNVPATLERMLVAGNNLIDPDNERYYDMRSELSYRFPRADIIRSERSENILNNMDRPEWANKTLNFAYQTGMSMADSAAAMSLAYLTGGGGIVDALFFSSAGNAAYKDARDRGATQDQAMAIGVLNGAAEALFEHISIETFMDNFVNNTPQLARSWLARTMSQALTEGSEEVSTSIANMLTDAWIMGDKSEYKQRIAEYSKTMPREEAEKKASLDQLKDIGMDALGGFASGALFGIGGLVIDAHNYASVGKKARSDQSMMDRYTRAAQLIGGNAQAALDAYNKNSTDMNAGKLCAAVQQSFDDMFGDNGDVDVSKDTIIGESADTKPEDIDEAKREKIIDKATAYSAILSGDKMNAAVAKSVMDILGEKELKKMGYDASSAETFSNSYNARLEQYGIESKYDATQRKLASFKAPDTGLRDNGPMRRESITGGKMTGAAAEQRIARQQAARGTAIVNSMKEAAANRVWANPEQGLSLTMSNGSTVTPMPGNMTAISRAEQERTGFKTRASATKGNVTYAVSGMEARAGLSNKQVYDEIMGGLTKEARQTARTYEKLADALGIKLVVHDVMTGTNGFIDEKGNMHVVLSGRQSLLRVTSHELTHYMKEHAASDYHVLRSHLIQEVGQERFDDMVKEKASEYGLDLETKQGRIVADDEVCAELCERMLSNTDAMEKFAQKNTSAAKTLRDHLLKILNAIMTALKDARNRNYGHSYSDLISQQETIESWVTGVQNAIENAEKRAQTTEGQIATTEEASGIDKNRTEANENNSAEADMDNELFMSESYRRAEKMKEDVLKRADKKTYVPGYSASEVESVLSAGVVGDRSNYEGNDYETVRGMIAQMIPDIVSVIEGKADLIETEEILKTAVGIMYDRYFEDEGNVSGLREVIPSLIGVDNTAKGDLKHQDQTLFQMSAKLSKALGKKVTLVSEQNANGQKNAKYKDAEKLEEVWERVRDRYGLSEDQDFSIDLTRLLDYVQRESDTRKSARDLYGSSLEDMIAATESNILEAVTDMYSKKTGNRYSLDIPHDGIQMKNTVEGSRDLLSRTTFSLDTDAIREAFTVIDTEGIEDGLAALKDVKHVGSFALKDISRFLDASAGKNKDLRNTLHAIFEVPHSEATGRYARGVERMQQKVLDIGQRAGVCDAKGKHFDSKKSAAIQNIGEGFSNTYTDLKLKVKDAEHVTVQAYEPGTDKLVVSEKDYTLKELRQAYGTNAADYVWDQVFHQAEDAQATGGKNGWIEQKVNTRPYTLADLKEAFPNEWQQLKAAADEFRQMYDDYIRDQNNMLATIYPIESEYADVEKLESAIDKKQERLVRHKDAVNQQLESLQKSLEAKEKEMAGKKRTDTKAYRQLVEQANKITDKIAEVKAEIAEYEANVKDELVKMNTLKAEMQNAVQKGDYSLKRMHRLQYRSDYFHHFSEMASGIQNLKSIFTNNTDIAPAIVGKSEGTRAKTKWAGYFQQRMGGDYTADALNGMLRYGQLAEYKLAFDPLTAYLRDVNKQIRDLSSDTNRDGLIRYIDQWADTIAGKSHKLDRVVSDAGMAPRKAMQVLQWVNSRVIQNTLLFNMRSALVQISNITNAKGIVKNNIDWMNGLRSWAMAARGDEAMASIMAQSNFLASRYMDGLELTDSKLKSVKQFAGWMLGALDEISAKATWWAAYQQYTRNPNVANNQYRAYDSAVDYADDVTRRTHAGRGVGELAPAMTSKVINFVAPFQVEVNNTWQLLKDNVKQKNFLGLLSTGLSVFLFNTAFEAIVGSTPLGFDFIRAVMDIVLGFTNDDDDDDPTVKTIAQRFAGELVGGLPFASQLVAAFGEDNAKKILGEDNDATRYGNTQIGVSAVMNALKGLKDIGSGLIEGRRVNWIDDLDDLLNLTLPFGGKQLTRTAQGIATVAKGYAGKYDKKGDEKVQFVTDGTILKYIHAGLFGKWALTEASEYFGEKRLLPQLFGKYEGPKSSLGTSVDANEYKAALATGITGKDYFTLKSDLNGYSMQAGKRAELMQNKNLTPEQKAKLDALLLAEKDDVIKVKGALVYKQSSDGKWNLKADYSSSDMFELSQMGEKIYTITNGLISDGFNPDEAINTAHIWLELKDTPDEIEGVDDRKLAFRRMLFESHAFTPEQKAKLDAAFCGTKTTADYTDDKLFEMSIVKQSGAYKKAATAASNGIDHDTFMELYDKMDTYVGEGRANYIRHEIMASNLTHEQKALMDDLLVSDKGENPDYSSQTWFEISMLGKSRYNEAKKGEAIGLKPDMYMTVYNKWKTIDAKDKNGKTVNGLKKKRAKEYLDSLNVSAPVYDYIWMSMFGYTSR